MNTVRKIVQSDETATLRLELPVSRPKRPFEVLVVWQEVADGLPEWPEGWIEATEGSIEDPTFTTVPSGPNSSARVRPSGRMIS